MTEWSLFVVPERRGTGAGTGFTKSRISCVFELIGSHFSLTVSIYQNASFMFLPRLCRIALASAIISAYCIPTYAAQFTSAEFLNWKPAGRDLYIDTTVGTAGSIASMNDQSHAKCLEDWYFSDKDAANSEIFDAMKANAQYHPRVIILAMLQKKCGTFKYRSAN